MYASCVHLDDEDSLGWFSNQNYLHIINVNTRGLAEDFIGWVDSELLSEAKQQNSMEKLQTQTHH